MKNLIFLLTVFLGSGGCATPPKFPQGKLVDLSYPFDESTVYWPTEPDFKLETESEGFTPKGYFYYANRFHAAEHGGTHVDAPKHFAERGKTVDEMPLDQLMGEGVLIDVSEKCAGDRDYQVKIKDFLDWEKKHGRIPEGAIVFLRTGFGQYWPDRARYLGSADKGKQAIRKLHFPGLDPGAAWWLVEERKIKAVGLDTPSIDYGRSRDFKAHVVLLEKDVPVLENLAQLDQLPPKEFYVVALPMKIKKGSGGPTRVTAIV
jgi:kynurenine formamidase